MPQAPKAALDYLNENPDTVDQFRSTYGYVPVPQRALEHLAQNPDTVEQFKQWYGEENIPQSFGKIQAGETSVLGAAGRGAARQLAPVAGSIGPAVAGATLGGAAGTFPPLFALTGGLSAPVLGFVGGLAGAVGGASVVNSAQESLFEHFPAFAKAIGQDPQQREADRLAHPTATATGEILAQGAFLRPNLAGGVKALSQGAAVGGGVSAAQQYHDTGSVDVKQTLQDAAAGAIFNKGYGAGRVLERGGQSVGDFVTRKSANAPTPSPSGQPDPQPIDDTDLHPEVNQQPVTKQPAPSAELDPIEHLQNLIAGAKTPSVKKILQSSLKDHTELRRIQQALPEYDAAIEQLKGNPATVDAAARLEAQKQKDLAMIEKIKAKVGSNTPPEPTKTPEPEDDSQDYTKSFVGESTNPREVDGPTLEDVPDVHEPFSREEDSPLDDSPEVGQRFAQRSTQEEAARTSPEADASRLAQSAKDTAIAKAGKAAEQPSQAPVEPSRPQVDKVATAKLGEVLEPALKGEPSEKIKRHTQREEVAKTEAQIKEDEINKAFEDHANAFDQVEEAPAETDPLTHINNLLEESGTRAHVGKAVSYLKNRLESDKVLSDFVGADARANDRSFDKERVNRKLEQAVNQANSLNRSKGKLAAQKREGQVAKEPVKAVTPKDAIANSKAAKATAKRESVVKKKSNGDTLKSEKTDDGSEVTVERNAELKNSGDGIKRTPLPHTDIQNVVDSLTKGFKVKPDIVISKNAKEAGFQEKPGKVTIGKFVRKDGKDTLHLFSDHITNHGDVRAVILHEAVGHYGIRGVFGKELNAVLSRLAVARPDLISAKINSYKLKGETTAERYEATLQAADEVVADFAQEGRKNHVLTDVVAAIRSALRKLPEFTVLGKKVSFKDLRLTDAEIIREIIQPSRKYLETGERDSGKAGRQFEGDPTALDIFKVTDKYRDQFTENSRENGPAFKGVIKDEHIVPDYPAEAFKLDYSASLPFQHIFRSVADRLRANTGTKPLGDAIINFVDSKARIRALFDIELSPSFKQLEKLSRKERLKVDREAARYFELLHKVSYDEHTTLAKKELLEHLQKIDQPTKDFIRGSKKALAAYAVELKKTGLKVKDKDGTLRDFAPLKDYFPLIIKSDIRRVFADPAKYHEEYFKLRQNLVDAGIVSNHAAAAKYLESFQTKYEVGNSKLNRYTTDFFGNIELGREHPLPSSFYDFSADTLLRYRDRAGERLAQIQSFGQDFSGHPDMFHQYGSKPNIDPKTKEYIERVHEEIYGAKGVGSFSRVLQATKTLVAGLQLGNPASALNNLTGLTLTGGLYSSKANVKALKEAVHTLNDPKLRELLNNDLVRKGIVSKDLSNLINDANAYQTVNHDLIDVYNTAASQFTSKALKLSGFNYAEKINRAYTYLVAKHTLVDGLSDVALNPDSINADKFRKLVKDENVNLRKLVNESTLSEDAPKPETDKFYRRVVNKTQGSYDLDAIPLWLNSPVGSWFFKYYKYTTQTTRLYVDNILKPAFEGDVKTFATRALPLLLKYHALTIAGGYVVGSIREAAFNYAFPAPDQDEIKAAFEKNPDYAPKVAVLLLAAQQSMQISAAAGLLGQASEYGRAIASSYDDPSQYSKLKNPIQAPGMAPISALLDLINRTIQTKGNLTKSDFDDVFERFFSQYRTGKRILAKVGSQLPEDVTDQIKYVTGGIVDPVYENKVEQARLQNSYVKNWLKKYEDEKGIQPSYSVTGGISQLFNVTGLPDFKRNADSSYNGRIKSALAAGEPNRAIEIVKESLGRYGDDVDAVVKATNSLKSSVNNGDPLIINGIPKDKDIEKDFYDWLSERVSKDSVREVKQHIKTYRDSARAFSSATGIDAFKEPETGAASEAVYTSNDRKQRAVDALKLKGIIK